jgi:hypothetical protein
VAGLLASPEVQKELAVNAEQKGLIEDMVKDLAAQRGGGGGQNRQDFQNLSQEERQKRFEEFQKQSAEREKKANDMAKMILEPKQFDRLSQLQLQREGAAALEREDVADKVGLDAEQKGKIKKIREASRGDRAGGGGFGNRNASQEERQKAAAEARERREKTNNEILAVLTPKQKETWEQMQGKKFDFPQPQGRRPGGN